MTDDPVMAATAAPAPAHVARRGSQLLSEPELRAHLAALLRVEHAGVFLGSGSSIGILEGRTMSQAWQAFRANDAESYKWLVSEKLVLADVDPNIEELADKVEICRIERARTEHVEKEKAEKAQASLRRALIGASLLRTDFWTGSADVLLLKSHRLLLQKLCGARQPGQPAPWLFTSNYDLAIEWAAESLGLACMNGFGGLHSRRFSPHNFDLGYRNVLAKGEARFGTYNFYLAKIHGSLNWIQEGTEVIEQPAAMAWAILKDVVGGGTDKIGRIVALPGAAKFFNTTGFVMGELFRRFTDFMSRPQTTLVVNGYSGSDDHINRLLLTALQNPTLQMVICARSASEDAGHLKVPDNRRWIRDIAALDLPQVTIVFGEAAEFSRLVENLPEPALYDEQALEIRRKLKEIKEGIN